MVGGVVWVDAVEVYHLHGRILHHLALGTEQWAIEGLMEQSPAAEIQQRSGLGHGQADMSSRYEANQGLV